MKKVKQFSVQNPPDWLNTEEKIDMLMKRNGVHPDNREYFINQSIEDHNKILRWLHAKPRKNKNRKTTVKMEGLQ